MAVVSCKLKYGSRRGPVRRKGAKYTYHETWIVRTDSADDDGLVVENAPGLPRGGQGYPEDAAAVVSGRDPHQKSDLVWEVAVTYTSRNMSLRRPPATPIEVTLVLPQRNWSSVVYRVSRTEDRAGKKYQNSAGDPYDPPPPEFRINRVLTILQSVLVHDERIAKKYLGATNTDPITIDQQMYPKFSAKLNRWDAQLKYLGDGYPYFDTQIELEFMGDGELWFPWKEVDRGPRHKVDGKEGLFLPKDDDGVTYQGTVLLDGQGFRASKTFPKAIQNEFDLFGPSKKLPFTSIGIPFLNAPPLDVQPPPGGGDPPPAPGPKPAPNGF